MRRSAETAASAQRAETMKKLDRKILVMLLILSILSLIFTNVIFTAHDSLIAIVEVNGQEYGRYSLAEKERKVLDVQTQFGYNKIEIVNGSVRVTETDCPDRLEVRQGEIRSSGQILVCLPNRLVVWLSGNREVDGVAY